ncbi:angiopoietin-related protein 1-like [Lingula anatina]|uniref:Angiopoietin-related protein 1-like n=1 Tax=Lingula anatina TaxID=7574 RepID=A0A1S3I9T9_LINAN|nr:angiopoietin-related protein 1-like [Lingula anatina]|eukprot:XP_013394621.1 angiopoietin-related protein 1-like [Lingula anatina]
MALSDDSASRYYTKVPHDCGNYIGLDGVHCINVNSMNRQLRVSCEEGWTVLMRRTGPELNFNRPWVDYRNGFGDVAGDHWLGLEAFHHLTNQGNYSLMVEVRSLLTDNYYWEIHHGFRIGPESKKYVLHKSLRGSGNLSEGNFWSYSFDMLFSTNDRTYGKRCSEKFRGGWWYNFCAMVSLTGKMAVPGECKKDCWPWFKHNGLPGSNNDNENALLRWAVMKIKKVD